MKNQRVLDLLESKDELIHSLEAQLTALQLVAGNNIPRGDDQAQPAMAIQNPSTRVTQPGTEDAWETRARSAEAQVS